MPDHVGSCRSKVKYYDKNLRFNMKWYSEKGNKRLFNEFFVKKKLHFENVSGGAYVRGETSEVCMA